MILRPYQQGALDALYTYWNAGGGHPLIEMATGTGKSLVIAKTIVDIAAGFPDLRVAVVVHVRELVEQNLEHLLALWPDAPYGINSAGLGQRDWDTPIVLAAIQSVWRNPKRLGVRHLVLCDEAHRIPHSGEGMYRSLLEGLRKLEPALRVAGFTATPYRLDTGRFDHGDGKIFDQIIFRYGIGDGVCDGWLAPLSSKGTKTTIDVSGVAIYGGEFVAGALEDAADEEAVVEAVCSEIIAHGEGRRSWLIFCCGIRHSEHVRDVLCARGVVAAAVTSKTPADERDEIVAAFHAGTIRAVTNVNVLTTGFNVQAIDLLAMLRPTLSTGLFIQMIGRASRKADGKRDALVLDFAGNVMRHGSVDRAGVGDDDEGRAKVDSRRAKQCPDCGELNALDAEYCASCAYEFPEPKPKHQAVADHVPILSGKREWLTVTGVDFRSHTKFSDPSAPPSLRVDYLCGLSSYSEYLSLQRTGYPREMAERWWFAIGGNAPAPFTVAQAIDRTGELDQVLAIVVERDGKYWRVVERRVRRPDGAEVEINRQHRCLMRQAAPKSEPVPLKDLMDDSIPY